MVNCQEQKLMCFYTAGCDPHSRPQRKEATREGLISAQWIISLVGASKDSAHFVLVCPIGAL